MAERLELPPSLADLRGQLYSVQYALDMARERLLLGHGRGTYVLLAEDRVPDDVVNDPMAFVNRPIEHAPSEWLEVMAESGVLGFALLAARLFAPLEILADPSPMVSGRKRSYRYFFDS